MPNSFAIPKALFHLKSISKPHKSELLFKKVLYQKLFSKNNEKISFYCLFPSLISTVNIDLKHAKTLESTSSSLIAISPTQSPVERVIKCIIKIVYKALKQERRKYSRVFYVNGENEQTAFYV
jgi:hypothetical protein